MSITILFALEITWILASAIYDLSTRRVPNRLFIVGGGIALIHVMTIARSGNWTWAALALSTLHVALALSLWRWGPWGGADAKFWIILAFIFAADVLLVTIVISHTVLAIDATVRTLRRQATRPLPGIPLMGVGLLASPYVLSWLD